MKRSKDIDLYIQGFDSKISQKLQKIRMICIEEVKEGNELMKYGLPTCEYFESLVHYGVSAHHIGLYITPSGIAAFQHIFDKLGLKYSTGAVQIPHAMVFPEKLIRGIVRFRVLEMQQKYASKKEQKNVRTHGQPQTQTL